MRSWKTWSLLLALTFLIGCGKTMQKAHEIAAQNLYQDAAYENAGQQGPSVVVLPGETQSTSYEFLAQVKPDALREYGEMELGKANFKVLDKASLANMHQEIALAVNLGDGSAAKRFAKLNVAPPRWFVLFDIVDVKTQTMAFTFTDKNAASFAGALMGGIFMGSAGAQVGQGVIGSINAAEEQRQWSVTLRYRVLDGATGQELHQGSFTEQALIQRELKGFLGVDAAQAGGLTLNTVVQRLIQKAVADIDKRHKPGAAALAEAEAAQKPAAARSGKAAKTAKAETSPKRPDKEQAQPAATGPEIVCVKQTLGGFVCQMPADWTTGAPPRAKEVALAQKPELAMLLERPKGGKAGLIETIAEFDVLRTAGPLVTLSEPESPLSRMGPAVALTGRQLEGRVFVLTNVAAKLTPEKLVEAVLAHMRNAAVVEPLGVETVEAKEGRRPIAVYKYIKVEQRKVVKEKADYDDEKREESKMISIPHYHNMAMAVTPKGNDLMLVVVIAPEESFLPHLEGVKKLVGSAT